MKTILGLLPTFMVPRYVEIMDELPKGPTGKILKYPLRKAGDRGITERTWEKDNQS